MTAGVHWNPRKKVKQFSVRPWVEPKHFRSRPVVELGESSLSRRG